MIEAGIFVSFGYEACMIKNIQMLRGVAALLVVICHSTMEWGPHPYLIQFWYKAGQAGVDLFFVISGFVIASVAVRDAENNAWPKSVATFTYSRAARIFPIYWVALAGASLAAWFISGSPTEGSGARLADLLTLRVANPALMVAWTLVFEMFFYQVMAAGMLVSGKWFRPVLLIGAILYALAIGIGMASGAKLSFSLSPIILEFIFGVLLFFVIDRGVKILPIPAVLVGVVWLVLAAHYIFPFGGDTTYIRPFAFGLPAVLIVYGMITIEPVWRAPGWAVLIGGASYSIYLWHGAIMHQVAKLKFAPYPSLAAGFVAIALMVLIGIASYLVFEVPMGRAAQYIKRRLFDARETAPAMKAAEQKL